MRLGGLQKLTLLDYPGAVACTVFTVGCNFRCPFCHNGSLVLRPDEQELTEQAFFSFLEKRSGILDGVCVSGGEPTLQKDLPAFLRNIRRRGLKIKLDTNGSNPAMLKVLLEERLLDYVAMDLKAAPEHYSLLTGIPAFNIAPVLQSVSILLQESVDYEFRTTLVKGLHTAADIPAIGACIAGAKQWFLQGFVDSGDLIMPGFEAFSGEEMVEFLALAQESVPTARLRGVDPAK